MGINKKQTTLIIISIIIWCVYLYFSGDNFIADGVACASIICMGWAVFMGDYKETKTDE